MAKERSWRRRQELQRDAIELGRVGGLIRGRGKRRFLCGFVRYGAGSLRASGSC